MIDATNGTSGAVESTQVQSVGSDSAPAPNNESANIPSVSNESSSDVVNSHDNEQKPVIPQEAFNDMAAAIKRKYYEKGLRDAEKRSSEQQPVFNQTQYANYGDDNLGTNPFVQQNFQDTSLENVVQNEMIKLLEIADKAQKEKEANAKAEMISKQLITKITDASKRYPDYNQVLSTAKMFSEAPQILDLANTVDNAGDVLYHLAKSPSKAGNILVLNQQSPHLAQMAIKELAGQINANKTAASQPTAPSPIDPIRPSRVGTDDGKPTLNDFKNAYRA